MISSATTCWIISTNLNPRAFITLLIDVLFYIERICFQKLFLSIQILQETGGAHNNFFMLKS